MKKSIRCAVSACAACHVCQAQVEFQHLDLSDAGLGISDTVSIHSTGLVVGYAGNGFIFARRSFIWLPSGDLQWVPPVPGVPRAEALGAAEDGSIVFLLDRSGFTGSGLWVWRNGDAAPTPVDMLGGLQSPWVRDTTRDGQFVIAASNGGPPAMRFRHIALAGTHQTVVPSVDILSVLAVSEDGRFVYASSKDSILRWTEELGLHEFTSPPEPPQLSGALMHPIDCSGDGLSIIGMSRQSDWFLDPAVGWTPLARWNGLETEFTTRSLSSDATRALGTALAAGHISVGAVLHENGRVRMVQDILADSGIDMTNWFLTDGRAISGDGSWVAGIGINPQGTQVAWSARLPARCVADCTDATGERVLDVFDLLCFQQRFAQGHPYANMQRDDQLDMFDMLAFVTEFARGCP